jgi:hypothetical protein
MAHTQFQWKIGVKPLSINEFSFHLKKNNMKYHVQNTIT